MNNSHPHPTTGTDPEDSRKNARYLITGMVHFRWQRVDGGWFDGIGLTRDMGKGGLFIESDSIPPVGSTLMITVTLPAESKPTVTLQLGCIGVVRNVRRTSGQTIGFGASAVFYVEVPRSKE